MKMSRFLVPVCGFLLMFCAVLASDTVQAQTPSILDKVTTQAAAGGYHSCALTTAGAVKCWGKNDHGQLGDGSTTEQLTPVAVSGLSSGVVTIAAGNSHSCALTTAGAVQCWGSNVNGQLGDGSTMDRLTPVAVSGLSSGVVAIAAGLYHSCALTTTGAVQCWGSNVDGQLGDGSTTDRHTPVAVSGLSSGVVAIATGEYHSCALTSGGAIQCWGWNGLGQLGDGSTVERHTPVGVSGLSSGGMAITAGGVHSCALTTAGAVQCWGSNGNGQLGDDSTTNRHTPVAVSGLSSGVAAITAGRYHSCALTTAGAAKCWGKNSAGQLGDGMFADQHTPVSVSGLSSGVAAITAGDSHSCALTTSGAAQCWGWNAYGQLGDNSTTVRLTPVAVSGLNGGVVAIALGFHHSCALTLTGAVQCWGDNDHGQLGDGSTTDRHTPVVVSGLSSDVAAIAAGADHSCALTTAGAVMCWGKNDHGQLGDGSTTERHTPVAVIDLGSIALKIGAGGDHTCAALAFVALKCWGSNSFGQLGNNTDIDRHAPVAVYVLSRGVVAITAGISHSCALNNQGTVHCWGRNDYGQLGDNSTTDRHYPVPVFGLGSGVEAITAGTSHSCALTTTGAVKCWGGNFNGQIGDGTSTERDTPVTVSGLSSGGIAIAAGAYHSCAVTTAGTVKCWGRNNRGQLGDGTAMSRDTPVAVSGLNIGVVAVTAGGDHTCALSPADGVKCWGSNSHGELGDSTTTDRQVPVTARVLAGQSITFNPPTSLGLTAEFVDLNASATSGGTVTFDTWTPDTCNISGNSVMILHAPEALCGVRASQVGGTRPTGGSDAPAPQQLRLIHITNFIFASGFEN